MEDKGAGNVFAVSREIWDDPDFPPEPFSEREAWIWLIGSCAWRERKVRGSNGTITLKRSEFMFSVRFLADKFGWTKSRIDRFLSKLKKRDMVRDTSRDGDKVYSIKNYNRFQFVDKKTGTASGTPDGTAAGHERDSSGTKKNKDNKGNKENNVFLTGASAPEGVLPSSQPDGKPAWWPTRDRYGYVPKDIDDKLMFAVGKAILGQSAGGVITNLLKFYEYDRRAVVDILLQAENQDDPMAWVQKALKRNHWERINPQHIRMPEENYRGAQ